MNAYEFDGVKYRKASVHQKEWGTKLITELDLDGNEHILDLGCGDGSLTEILAQAVPDGRVVGIDASQGMIDVAEELSSDNLSFYFMDINDLPYAAAFDLIFSNATLHWVKDHEKLLDNCYRALKPEGVIRFNFAGDGNCSNFYEIVKDVMGLEQYSQYFSDFNWPWYMPSVDEYQAVVEDSSFTGVDVWGENADRYFPNASAMTGWINQPSIVPFLKCVYPYDRESFRTEVINRMLDTTKQEDNTYFETFRRINVHAKKE
jgi:trans-aconitate methyltransferase